MCMMGGIAGGFRDAAKNILQGAATAELKAIAQAAAHRLERGIWTRFLAIPLSLDCTVSLPRKPSFSCLGLRDHHIDIVSE